MSKHKLFVNILTLFGLFLGAGAVILAIKGHIGLAIAMIFLSALIDRYDGKWARKYRVESMLGAWLDTSNDVVSFLLAPIALLFILGWLPLDFISIFVVVLWLAAGFYRLYRFQHQADKAEIVQGLPSTMAGTLLLLMATILSLIGTILIHPLLLFVLLLLSLAMMSSRRYKKY